MVRESTRRVWFFLWRTQMVLLILVFFVSCGAAKKNDNAQVETETPGKPPPDTTLGPGDVFDVRVYGEKDLSNSYRVASDGSIDFPLVGTVNVTGLTPAKVASLLEQSLLDRDYLKNPQVSIFVKEYNSKKISVFGQVNKPGTFPYQDGMSVVEAISIAGGFNSLAKKNDTVVIRVLDGKKTRFQVPVVSIGQGQASNFVLRPGDIVFVPERVF